MRHFKDVETVTECANPACDKMTVAKPLVGAVISYTGSDMEFAYCSNRCVNADYDRSSDLAESKSRYWAHVMATYEDEERMIGAHLAAFIEDAQRNCIVKMPVTSKSVISKAERKAITAILDKAHLLRNTLPVANATVTNNDILSAVLSDLQDVLTDTFGGSELTQLLTENVDAQEAAVNMSRCGVCHGEMYWHDAAKEYRHYQLFTDHVAVMEADDDPCMCGRSDKHTH